MLTNEIYLFSIPIYMTKIFYWKSKIIPGKVTYEDNIAIALIPTPRIQSLESFPASGAKSARW